MVGSISFYILCHPPMYDSSCCSITVWLCSLILIMWLSLSVHGNPPVTMIISIVIMVRYVHRKYIPKETLYLSFFGIKIGIISVGFGK